MRFDSVDVVSVWVPRPKHEKWRDYMPLLALQALTVEHFRHGHIIMCDQHVRDGSLKGLRPGVRLVHFQAEDSLMRAILQGQLAFFEQWDEARPIVLVDLDCVVCENLCGAFDFVPGDWLMGFTVRPNNIAPIQNGAMYFAPGSRDAAIKLFTKALSMCGDHWGGDQESIAKALAPVPHGPGLIDKRFGVSVAWLCPDQFNYSPKAIRQKPVRGRFIAHFKGDSKSIAHTFVKQYLRDQIRG